MQVSNSNIPIQLRYESPIQNYFTQQCLNKNILYTQPYQISNFYQQESLNQQHSLIQNRLFYCPIPTQLKLNPNRSRPTSLQHRRAYSQQNIPNTSSNIITNSYQNSFQKDYSNYRSQHQIIYPQNYLLTNNFQTKERKNSLNQIFPAQQRQSIPVFNPPILQRNLNICLRPKQKSSTKQDCIKIPIQKKTESNQKSLIQESPKNKENEQEGQQVVKQGREKIQVLIDQQKKKIEKLMIQNQQKTKSNENNKEPFRQFDLNINNEFKSMEKSEVQLLKQEIEELKQTNKQLENKVKDLENENQILKEKNQDLKECKQKLDISKVQHKSFDEEFNLSISQLNQGNKDIFENPMIGQKENIKIQNEKFDQQQESIPQFLSNSTSIEHQREDEEQHLQPILEIEL